jgi:5-carboxymethyl-2-hydroxymuconate isomerase
MAAAASPPVAPWFMPLVMARAIAFVAATLVLLTGRPGRSRRRAGAALAIIFGALFAAERAYQLFG